MNSKHIALEGQRIGFFGRGGSGKSTLTARTRGALYVLNRVPDLETEDQLREALTEQGIRPGAVLPDDPALRRAWLAGTSLSSAHAQAEALKSARALSEGQGRWPASEEAPRSPLPRAF